MTPKHNMASFGHGYKRTRRVRTTLFDLLMVLNEEVTAGEEELIPQIVYYYIKSGKLKFV
jgi:hypothetical protein